MFYWVSFNEHREKYHIKIVYQAECEKYDAKQHFKNAIFFNDTVAQGIAWPSIPLCDPKRAHKFRSEKALYNEIINTYQ